MFKSRTHYRTNHSVGSSQQFSAHLFPFMCHNIAIPPSLALFQHLVAVKRIKRHFRANLLRHSSECHHHFLVCFDQLCLHRQASTPPRLLQVTSSIFQTTL